MIPNFKTNFVFAQQTDNSALNLKSKTSQVNTASDFKAVFDKTVSSSRQNAPYNKGMKAEKDVAPSNDTQLKYKTFRDVRTEQTADNRESTVKESKSNYSSEVVKSESDKISAPSEKYSEQVNVLAQLLGITPSELAKLAEELGFSAEDFDNTDKTSQIVDKLGEQLQLNSSQKELLMKLVQEISSQVKSSDNKAEVPAQASVQAAADNMSQVNQKIGVLSDISETIKAKINELLQNSQVENETISSEVARAIAAMKAQLQNRADFSAGTSTEAGSIINDTINAAQTLKAQENSSDSKTAKNSNGDTSNELNSEVRSTTDKGEVAAEVKNVSVQVNTNADQNSQQQALQGFSQIKQGIVNNQAEVTKSTFAMPQTIKTSDILNQVVEQTKVVIGQDKTEMVIHLKPDHLGKLELKVITEQGIVAAKFIAENQQVKEIIETNMQLLKDSLEKQGINVEGVSVQVGQDKKNEYQNSSSGNKNSGFTGRVKSASDAKVSSGVRGTIMETLPERLAQYSYESNTINLTA